MLFNTGAAKILGVSAQITLGWLLSHDDFALYAIAVSVTSFTALLSDNGLRNFLIQKQGDYDRFKGPVFWLSLTLNVAAGAVILCIAPALAHAYKEPGLQVVLAVIACASVVATPATVLSAKLRIGLEFRILSLIQISSSVIRCVGMVGLAWYGLGPLSFVLPVIVSSVCESIAIWWITRLTPWLDPTGYQQWPYILGQTKWILLSACATGIFNNGLYFTLGFFVSKSVVGVYYFAYQFVVQIGLLLSHNLFQVLFPAFSQLTHDPQRSRLALERSLQLATWLAAPTLAVIAIYDPLEALVWQGKWLESVQPVQILCVFYPITVVLSVVNASQAALGHFQQMAVMMLLLAAATIAGGMVGATLTKNAIGVALGAGSCLFAGSLVYLRSILETSGIATSLVLISLSQRWAIALLSAGISVLMDGFLMTFLTPAVRVLANGLLFVSIFTIASRTIFPRQMLQMAEVMPNRLRTPFVRLMRLSTFECAP